MRPNKSWTHLTALIASAAGLTLALAACGSSGGSTPPANSKAAGTVTANGISAARCAQNKAAGTIVFETSFDYAAAASILDVVTAADRGYFKDMCLNVELKPGFSTDNVALVSANKVQISSLGSDSEVFAAVGKQANLVGIATYSKIPISELITPTSANITNLKQLNGATVGIKGALPYEVTAMLAKAGADINSLKQVQVSYDPTIIDKGRIKALPVYKSNEIYQLNAQHIKYDVFDPATYHVAGSFGTMIANRSFAQSHPTAVEDFLRADLRGFEWANTNQAAAVQYAQRRLDPKLNITPDVSAFRWKVEAGLVVKSTPSGQPVAAIDQALLQREYAQDTQLKLVPSGIDIKKCFDASYINAVYHGSTLIWPSKFS
jgi:NitT/TauT family transport system substrate-binding protein